MKKPHLLSFKNVSKIYRLGEYKIKAIDNISLDINPGDYMVAMGPSGSGKSTFLNLIGLLDHPTHGHITLEGEDVSKLSESKLAQIRNKKIGFVFQSYNLLPRTTALENVAVPLVYAGIKGAERHKMAMKTLEELELADRSHHTPNQLSGGQQQRVAIARALVNNPAIILADEPTGNLDSKSGKEIMKIFNKINESGRTIIVVTHDPMIAKHAERLIKLKDGKIREEK